MWHADGTGFRLPRGAAVLEVGDGARLARLLDVVGGARGSALAAPRVTRSWFGAALAPGGFRTDDGGLVLRARLGTPTTVGLVGPSVHRASMAPAGLLGLRDEHHDGDVLLRYDAQVLASREVDGVLQGATMTVPVWVAVDPAHLEVVPGAGALTPQRVQQIRTARDQFGVAVQDVTGAQAVLRTSEELQARVLYDFDVASGRPDGAQDNDWRRAADARRAVARAEQALRVAERRFLDAKRTADKVVDASRQGFSGVSSPRSPELAQPGGVVSAPVLPTDVETRQKLQTALESQLRTLGRDTEHLHATIQDAVAQRLQDDLAGTVRRGATIHSESEDTTAGRRTVIVAIRRRPVGLSTRSATPHALDVRLHVEVVTAPPASRPSRGLRWWRKPPVFEQHSRIVTASWMRLDIAPISTSPSNGQNVANPLEGESPGRAATTGRSSFGALRTGTQSAVVVGPGRAVAAPRRPATVVMHHSRGLLRRNEAMGPVSGRSARAAEELRIVTQRVFATGSTRNSGNYSDGSAAQRIAAAVGALDHAVLDPGARPSRNSFRVNGPLGGADVEIGVTRRGDPATTASGTPDDLSVHVVVRGPVRHRRTTPAPTAAVKRAGGVRRAARGILTARAEKLARGPEERRAQHSTGQSRTPRPVTTAGPVVRAAIVRVSHLALPPADATNELRPPDPGAVPAVVPAHLLGPVWTSNVGGVDIDVDRDSLRSTLGAALDSIVSGRPTGRLTSLLSTPRLLISHTGGSRGGRTSYRSPLRSERDISALGALVATFDPRNPGRWTTLPSSSRVQVRIVPAGIETGQHVGSVDGGPARRQRFDGAVEVRIEVRMPSKGPDPSAVQARSVHLPATITVDTALLGPAVTNARPDVDNTPAPAGGDPLPQASRRWEVPFDPRRDAPLAPQLVALAHLDRVRSAIAGVVRGVSAKSAVVARDEQVRDDLDDVATPQDLLAAAREGGAIVTLQRAGVMVSVRADLPAGAEDTFDPADPRPQITDVVWTIAAYDVRQPHLIARQTADGARFFDDRHNTDPDIGGVPGTRRPVRVPREGTKLVVALGAIRTGVVPASGTTPLTALAPARPSPDTDDPSFGPSEAPSDTDGAVTDGALADLHPDDALVTLNSSMGLLQFVDTPSTLEQVRAGLDSFIRGLGRVPLVGDVPDSVDALARAIVQNPEAFGGDGAQVGLAYLNADGTTSTAPMNVSLGVKGVRNVEQDPNGRGYHLNNRHMRSHGYRTLKTSQRPIQFSIPSVLFSPVGPTFRFGGDRLITSTEGAQTSVERHDENKFLGAQSTWDADLELQVTALEEIDPGVVELPVASSLRARVQTPHSLAGLSGTANGTYLEMDESGAAALGRLRTFVVEDVVNDGGYREALDALPLALREPGSPGERLLNMAVTADVLRHDLASMLTRSNGPGAATMSDDHRVFDGAVSARRRTARPLRVLPITQLHGAKVTSGTRIVHERSRGRNRRYTLNVAAGLMGGFSVPGLDGFVITALGTSSRSGGVSSGERRGVGRRQRVKTSVPRVYALLQVEVDESFLSPVDGRWYPLMTGLPMTALVSIAVDEYSTAFPNYPLPAPLQALPAGRVLPPPSLVVPVRGPAPAVPLAAPAGGGPSVRSVVDAVPSWARAHDTSLVNVGLDVKAQETLAALVLREIELAGARHFLPPDAEGAPGGGAVDVQARVLVDDRLRREQQLSNERALGNLLGPEALRLLGHGEETLRIDEGFRYVEELKITLRRALVHPPASAPAPRMHPAVQVASDSSLRQERSVALSASSSRGLEVTARIRAGLPHNPVAGFGPIASQDYQEVRSQGQESTDQIEVREAVETTTGTIVGDATLQVEVQVTRVRWQRRLARDLRRPVDAIMQTRWPPEQSKTLFSSGGLDGRVRPIPRVEVPAEVRVWKGFHQLGELAELSNDSEITVFSRDGDVSYGGAVSTLHEGANPLPSRTVLRTVGIDQVRAEVHRMARVLLTPQQYLAVEAQIDELVDNGVLRELRPLTVRAGALRIAVVPRVLRPTAVSVLPQGLRTDGINIHTMASSVTSNSGVSFTSLLGMGARILSEAGGDAGAERVTVLPNLLWRGVKEWSSSRAQKLQAAQKAMFMVDGDEARVLVRGGLQYEVTVEVDSPGFLSRWSGSRPGQTQLGSTVSVPRGVLSVPELQVALLANILPAPEALSGTPLASPAQQLTVNSGLGSERTFSDSILIKFPDLSALQQRLYQALGADAERLFPSTGSGRLSGNDSALAEFLSSDGLTSNSSDLSTAEGAQLTLVDESDGSAVHAILTVDQGEPIDEDPEPPSRQHELTQIISLAFSQSWGRTWAWALQLSGAFGFREFQNGRTEQESLGGGVSLGYRRAVTDSGEFGIESIARWRSHGLRHQIRRPVRSVTLQLLRPGHQEPLRVVLRAPGDALWSVDTSLLRVAGPVTIPQPGPGPRTPADRMTILDVERDISSAHSGASAPVRSQSRWFHGISEMREAADLLLERAPKGDLSATMAVSELRTLMRPGVMRPAIGRLTSPHGLELPASGMTLHATLYNPRITGTGFDDELEFTDPGFANTVPPVSATNTGVQSGLDRGVAFTPGLGISGGPGQNAPGSYPGANVAGATPARLHEAGGSTASGRANVSQERGPSVTVSYDVQFTLVSVSSRGQVAAQWSTSDGLGLLMLETTAAVEHPGMRFDPAARADPALFAAVQSASQEMDAAMADVYSDYLADRSDASALAAPLSRLAAASTERAAAVDALLTAKAAADRVLDLAGRGPQNPSRFAISSREPQRLATIVEEPEFIDGLPVLPEVESGTDPVPQTDPFPEADPVSEADPVPEVVGALRAEVADVPDWLTGTTRDHVVTAIDDSLAALLGDRPSVAQRQLLDGVVTMIAGGRDRVSLPPVRVPGDGSRVRRSVALDIVRRGRVDAATGTVTPGLALEWRMQVTPRSSFAPLTRAATALQRSRPAPMVRRGWAPLDTSTGPRPAVPASARPVGTSAGTPAGIPAVSGVATASGAAPVPGSVVRPSQAPLLGDGTSAPVAAAFLVGGAKRVAAQLAALSADALSVDGSARHVEFHQDRAGAGSSTPRRWVLDVEARDPATGTAAFRLSKQTVAGRRPSSLRRLVMRPVSHAMRLYRTAMGEHHALGREVLRFGRKVGGTVVVHGTSAPAVGTGVRALAGRHFPQPREGAGRSVLDLVLDEVAAMTRRQNLTFSTAAGAQVRDLLGGDLAGLASGRYALVDPGLQQRIAQAWRGGRSATSHPGTEVHLHVAPSEGNDVTLTVTVGGRGRHVGERVQWQVPAQRPAGNIESLGFESVDPQQIPGEAGRVSSTRDMGLDPVPAAPIGFTEPVRVVEAAERVGDQVLTHLTGPATAAAELRVFRTPDGRVSAGRFVVDPDGRPQVERVAGQVFRTPSGRVVAARVQHRPDGTLRLEEDVAPPVLRGGVQPRVDAPDTAGSRPSSSSSTAAESSSSTSDVPVPFRSVTAPEIPATVVSESVASLVNAVDNNGGQDLVGQDPFGQEKVGQDSAAQDTAVGNARVDNAAATERALAPDPAAVPTASEPVQPQGSARVVRAPRWTSSALETVPEEEPDAGSAQELPSPSVGTSAPGTTDADVKLQTSRTRRTSRLIEQMDISAPEGFFDQPQSPVDRVEPVAVLGQV
ncbi:MAG: hypothetical protein ACRYF3_04750, partial [Janthinobacterium lividum]